MTSTLKMADLHAIFNILYICAVFKKTLRVSGAIEAVETGQASQPAGAKQARFKQREEIHFFESRDKTIGGEKSKEENYLLEKTVIWISQENKKYSE